jgi:hypothetical protein
MMALHPAPTSPAVAHRNVEAAHHSPPYDVFLILRFATLRLYAPTQCGQRFSVRTGV